MKALEGLKVIEICQIAAGPFCGSLLADMGADVIKIEPPDGDGLRQWPPISNGDSENFAALNRNKRSIVLDLKRPGDVQDAIELIGQADVVIENFRPGVMRRLGLGYDVLAALYPALVYCSISAFGQEGPRVEQGGFDLTVQAISGVMSVTGEPDGPPVKCGVPICDFGAGLYAAYSIACAVLKARRDGVGDHIDVSMLGAALGMAALQTSEYFGTSRDPEKMGSAHPRNAPYQAFKASDGYFALAAGNDKLWRATCACLGREDLARDLEFSTTALRAKHQKRLRELLEAEFAKSTARQLVDRLTAAGVPCAPINSYSQILNDEQVRHMDWVQPLELQGGTRTLTVACPVKMRGQAFEITRRPPGLGEHTEEILSELSDKRLMRA